ncbi:MAG: AI-2E family transporter [Anaerolineales bacterium]
MRGRPVAVRSPPSHAQSCQRSAIRCCGRPPRHGTLQWWLVSQLILMTLVAVSVSLYLMAVGAPYALLLGLLAGLLNFIPFLGPILAGIPILLAVVTEGATTIMIVMGGFLIIQWIEGYLIAPFIQHRIIRLAPAISLAFLTVMGALFGGLGVALATPVLAVVRVMTIELYVRDTLGDREAEVA